jgi:hypothetical protein
LRAEASARNSGGDGTRRRVEGTEIERELGMKNVAGWFCFVLLLGAVAGFAAGKQNVQAQYIDNKSTRYLAGVVTYGQASDAFCIFDTQTNRLVCYTFGGNKRLELLAVREASWDLKLVSWGKQEPTVVEVKEAFEKSEKERVEKEKAQEKK